MAVYTREQAEKDTKLKILKNNVVYSMEDKKIVGKLDEGVTTAITPENASAYNRARQEKFKQAAADRIQQEIGAIEPGITTPFAAWGVLNSRLAVQIMDSDKPRGKDLEILGRNMGAIGSQEGDNTSISSQDDTARQLLLEIARAAGEQIGQAIVHASDNYTYLNHEQPIDAACDDVDDDSQGDSVEADEK